MPGAIELGDYSGMSAESTAVGVGARSGHMPWLLGAALRDDGINLANDEEMTGTTTRDRNVLPGYSPLAANTLGKMTAKAVARKAT